MNCNASILFSASAYDTLSQKYRERGLHRGDDTETGWYKVDSREGCKLTAQYLEVRPLRGKIT